MALTYRNGEVSEGRCGGQRKSAIPGQEEGPCFLLRNDDLSSKHLPMPASPGVIVQAPDNGGTACAPCALALTSTHRIHTTGPLRP